MSSQLAVSLRPALSLAFSFSMFLENQFICSISYVKFGYNQHICSQFLFDQHSSIRNRRRHQRRKITRSTQPGFSVIYQHQHQHLAVRMDRVRQKRDRCRGGEGMKFQLFCSLAHTLFFFIWITFTLSRALKVGLEAWTPTLAWAVQI